MREKYTVTVGEFATCLLAGLDSAQSWLRPAMNEAEIWRTAQQMIQQYGAEAGTQARLRAEKLKEFAIADEAEDWNRIAKAIAELERKTPEEGKKPN